MYIQLCSRVLMGMSHSETLLHGSNEHQSLPVKGVIMELHGEQRWVGGAETGVMSERVLALLMEPQSALLLAKAYTGCYGSKHLPFYFSFCLNKKVMWWHHSAVLLLHSIARVHWYIYIYIYIQCSIYTHTYIYIYIHTNIFTIFQGTLSQKKVNPSLSFLSFLTPLSVLTHSFWKYTRPCQSATHHLASIDCTSCQRGQSLCPPAPQSSSRTPSSLCKSDRHCAFHSAQTIDQAIKHN